MPTRKYVYWVEQMDEGLAPEVGGKNANLGRLCKIGVPVPVGFGVSANAFKTFIDFTGLRARIENYVCGKNLLDMGQVMSTSKDLREMVEEAEIPEAIKLELLEAYEELRRRVGGDVSVAVRSSGISEDMASSSCAGLFESYLNVRGANFLLDRVKKVWSSAFTDRVLVYKLKKGIEITEGLGVCILEMVNAKSAGVTFTADPNTGDRSKAIIEANWGLGESVVGGGAEGSVIPDRWVVRKEKLEIEEKRLGKKTKAIVYREEGGTVEKEIDVITQRQFCLTDEKIRDIVRFSVAVEGYYGVPQDIEWAVDKNDQLYFLQTRPLICSVREPVESAIQAILTKFLR